MDLITDHETSYEAVDELQKTALLGFKGFHIGMELNWFEKSYHVPIYGD